MLLLGLAPSNGVICTNTTYFDVVIRATNSNNLVNMGKISMIVTKKKNKTQRKEKMRVNIGQNNDHKRKIR